MENNTNTPQELLYFSFFVFVNSEFNAILPELSSIITYTNLLQLVDIAGGKSIQIPLKQELKSAFHTLVYYYYVYMRGEDEETVIHKYSLNKYILRWTKKDMKIFEKLIQKEGIQFPESFNDSKLVKQMLKDLN